MIPFAGEKLAALQSRYPKALVTLHRPDENMQASPPLTPDNCFDCEEGWRMMVSRQLMPSGREMLHISASFDIEGGVFRWLKAYTEANGRAEAMRHFAENLVPAWFRRLSGDARPLELLGWTHEKIIPHFALWLPKESA